MSNKKISPDTWLGGILVNNCLLIANGYLQFASAVTMAI